MLVGVEVLGASSTAAVWFKDEFAGSVGVAPGGAVSLSALAAVTGIGHFTWAEVPV